MIIRPKSVSRVRTSLRHLMRSSLIERLTTDQKAGSIPARRAKAIFVTSEAEETPVAQQERAVVLNCVRVRVLAP